MRLLPVSPDLPGRCGVTRQTRIEVATLVGLAVLSGLILAAFASLACPAPSDSDPCTGAGFNRAVVLILAAVTLGLLAAPVAFLAEYAVRRQIVYRGSWGRALRRAALLSVAVASLGGLRLGGALSPVALLIVIGLLGVVEWMAIRRFDHR